jgi:hypothetical protein
MIKVVGLVLVSYSSIISSIVGLVNDQVCRRIIGGRDRGLMNAALTNQKQENSDQVYADNLVKRRGDHIICKVYL